MKSIRQFVFLTTFIFGLLPTVTSGPVEKRLDSGTSETGGTAAVQYVDPKTKTLWIKNYHVRKSDALIVEIVYRNDTDTWSSNDLGNSVTGSRGGGLAALAYISADNNPTINLYYDDLNTGYLKSLNWTQNDGWVVDTAYNTIAAQFTNTSRSSAAVTFDAPVLTLQVYVTSGNTTITRITWTSSVGWDNNLLQITPGGTISRDVAAVVSGKGRVGVDLSVFYALEAASGNWNIHEISYSHTAHAWAERAVPTIFQNVHGPNGVGLAAIAWESGSGTKGWSIRVYVQGDNYVELATDDLSTWVSKTLGNSSAEGVIPQAEISAVYWSPGRTLNSIRYFQVKCTEPTCADPIIQVNTWDNQVANAWYSYAIAIDSEL